MPQYRKKPVVITAHQWFRNGDHPDDYVHEQGGFDIKGNLTTYSAEKRRQLKWEGEVVRYYRRPNMSAQSVCNKCSGKMHDHGWIDTKEGGHIVCPGDFIITGVQGEMYPCKPDIFEATYEPV